MTYDDWKLASPEGADAANDRERTKRFAKPRDPTRHGSGCEGCPRCIGPDGRKSALSAEPAWAMPDETTRHPRLVACPNCLGKRRLQVASSSFGVCLFCDDGKVTAETRSIHAALVAMGLWARRRGVAS